MRPVDSRDMLVVCVRAVCLRWVRWRCRAFLQRWLGAVLRLRGGRVVESVDEDI